MRKASRARDRRRRFHEVVSVRSKVGRSPCALLSSPRSRKELLSSSLHLDKDFLGNSSLWYTYIRLSALSLGSNHTFEIRASFTPSSSFLFRPRPAVYITVYLPPLTSHWESQLVIVAVDGFTPFHTDMTRTFEPFAKV